jgi:tRNA threonylcarbamoyladenosine dehydratase
MARIHQLSFPEASGVLNWRHRLNGNMEWVYTMFNYDEAFSRNIGWVTEAEQQMLRGKRVAIGGLGGVGGSHLMVLTRLGIGAFNIADLDDFDYPNFNRQYGATLSTVNQSKARVMQEAILDINPELDLKVFHEGIQESNLDDFLAGVDIYVDSLDIFALDIRRKVFQRCYELGIPTITAAPMGMGTAFLIFMPGKMSFEEYFALDGLSFEDQISYFVIGVSPSVQQRTYLVDKSSVNFFKHKVPSTVMGIEISAGVACTQVLKILLNRGKIVCAPRGLHFDAYRNRLRKTWRPFGNRNPVQKVMYRIFQSILKAN